MSLKVRAKKIVRELPYPVGRFLSFIPFQFVFGKAYNDFKKEIDLFSDYKISRQRAYTLKKLQYITAYSYKNISFYHDFYDKNHFHPSELKTFRDIKKIPILTKKDLLKYKLSERSASEKASDKINTGGTTGQPLEFYIEHNAWAREWAHMMHIWKNVGYKKTNLKLNFRGRNIGSNIYKYNAVGNEYIINTFKDPELLCEAIESLVENKNIQYLHGYPSAIYEFAKYIRKQNPGLQNQLNRTLEGVLLGSEYPAPVYRDLIDKIFECPNISWYGHSEMCILAYEKKEPWLYEPMGSYGYCEAVPNGSGSFRLVGTSFYNTASPFIRYDTGDLVMPVRQEKGLLKSFKIEEGRVGEFIRDKSGHRISLTALVFGRHHPIFGNAKFIQVYQPKNGEAEILITTTATDKITEKEARANFDATNVELDIKFKIINKPYRSKSGKVPLLVKEI